MRLVGPIFGGGFDKKLGRHKKSVALQPCKPALRIVDLNLRHKSAFVSDVTQGETFVLVYMHNVDFLVFLRLSLLVI